MEAKAILYHSNEAEKCDMFIAKTDYLIESQNLKDDKWLGTGMYFWDNLGNAKWWNEKQKEKHIEKQYSIVAVNADLTNILDLTDKDICDATEKLWQAICNRKHLDANQPLGNKLNMLFDENGFYAIYYVIKVYGRYVYYGKNSFFEFNPFGKIAEPTMAIKCIYDIKNSECIIEKAYLEE